MDKLKNKFLNYKNGFTLMEMMITLVIIGLISALITPILINKSFEQSTIAKVKKGLSTLAQAKKLAEAKNGSITRWNYGSGISAQTASKFWKYIKPHLSVTKDCGSSTDCYISTNVKLLNGNSWTNYNTDSKYYKFILSDGSVMWFRTGNADDSGYTEESLAVFWYDVNGVERPNKVGVDIFTYAVFKGGVYPYIKNDCNKNSTGWGCSGYIIRKGNMDYFY